MQRRFALASAFALASVFAPCAHGQTTTWTGAFNDLWHNPLNWTTGTPVPVVNASVPATANSPRVPSGLAATCDTLEIEDAASVTLEGTASLLLLEDLRLSGGTLACTGSASVSIARDLEQSGAGSVAPGSSAVSFTGSGEIASSTSVSFASVSIASGTTRSLSAPRLVVSANWTSSGAILTGAPVLEFTGNGTTTSSGTPLPAVEVSSGTRNLGAAGIEAAQLAVSGGTLRIPDDATLTVAGSCELSGGVLQFVSTSAGVETLDCGGNCHFTGTSAIASADTRINCTGDWSSSPASGPADGLVTLDGSGEIAASGAGTEALFPDLVLAAGARTLAGDLTLTATSVSIEAPASLLVADRRLAVPGGPITVSGALSIGAGGELALGESCAIAVGPSGSLALIGDSSAPAIVAGESGGGYAFLVDGAVAARNFRFEEMGPGGIVLGANATVAPAPDDLRGGTFDRGTPGGVLLDVQLPGAPVLPYLAFEDSSGAIPANVRRVSGGEATLYNWSGAHGGEAFEDDPTQDPGTDPDGLVVWPPAAATELLGFEARNGPEKVFLEWEATAVVDVDAFLVDRAPDPSGPFSPLLEVAPAGPGAYAFEVAAPENATFTYRLSERLTHGVVNELATDDATAYDADLPADILTVGAGQSFATIQQAIDAAFFPTHAIRVAPGTYPPFSIDAPAGTLHVLADGSGPVVIDTSLGPVEIRNVGSAQAVELSGLVLGNGSSTQPSVIVESSAGAVILDDCEVHGGPGQPGVRVTGSTATTLQSCTADGSPGLLAEDESAVYAGRGSIDELEAHGGSIARICQVPTSATADLFSQVIEFEGVMPQLTLPAELQVIGVPFTASIEAEPDRFWQLGVSPLYLPVELDDPSFWQMLLVMNPFAYITLGEGTTDGAGHDSLELEVPPEGKFLGDQIVLQSWVVWVTGDEVHVRFSNAETLFLVP